MPYDLKEIAAINGMPGLYRLVSPTRTGVIIESLGDKAARSVASARNKVSLLQEISIYTQDYDQTVALTEVFERIHQQHGAELALTSKSDDRDLTAFMAGVVPDYDRDRVYMSDIKKLINWYQIVSKSLPYQAPAADSGEDAATAPTPPVAADTSPRPTDDDESAQPAHEEEPAADEALSTVGIIPAAPEPTRPINPEVTEGPVKAK